MSHPDPTRTYEEDEEYWKFKEGPKYEVPPADFAAFEAKLRADLEDLSEEKEESRQYAKDEAAEAKYDSWKDEQ